MKINKLNSLSQEEAKEVFLKCCGSVKWADKMTKALPFSSENELYKTADNIWNVLDKSDWLEAFTHHPKIGNINSLKEKFTNTKDIAAGEQSGVNTATDEVLRQLAEYNDRYEKKYGYIFIVCATGKNADEMLAILKERYNNEASVEILNAAKEQSKITKIRLQKIL